MTPDAREFRVSPEEEKKRRILFPVLLFALAAEIAVIAGLIFVLPLPNLRRAGWADILLLLACLAPVAFPLILYHFWAVKNAVDAVILRPDEMKVVRRGAGSVIPYKDIAAASLAFPYNFKDRHSDRLELFLRDRRGRRMAAIGSAISGFRQLAAEIRAKAAEAGMTDPGEAGDRIFQLARRRLDNRVSIAVCVLAALISAAVMIYCLRDMDRYRRVFFGGLITWGRVIRVTDSGHNLHRVKYRYRDRGGIEYGREVLLNRSLNDRFPVGSRNLPIVFLPSDPSFSRIVGERNGHMRVFLILASAVFGVMAGLGLFFATGHDVEKLDGRVILLRRGGVVEDRRIKMDADAPM